MRKQGIYKITNTLNKKMYIGSSKNIKHRLKVHLRNLINNNHPNSRLQNSFNKYGIEHFSFSVVSYQPDLSKEDLLELEELIINSYEREELFNLQFQTNGGGADALSKETYLLDLSGNIIKKYESTNDCYIKNGRVIGDYSCLNTRSILLGVYRVVTKEFYDSNIETIKSWRPYTSHTLILKEYKDFLRPLLMKDTVTGEEFIFNTLLEAGEHINRSRERVRQCLINGKLISKRYSITKLNKPEDFYLYEYVKE